MRMVFWKVIYSFLIIYDLFKEFYEICFVIILNWNIYCQIYLLHRKTAEYIYSQLKIHTSKLHISFPCTVEHILEEVDPLSKGYYEKYILIKIAYFFGRG